MAVTQDGANRTNIYATPSVLVEPRDAHGRVRGVYDSVTLAAQNINSTAIMGPNIPPNARIVFYSFVHANLTANTAYKLEHIDSAGGVTTIFASAATTSAGTIEDHIVVTADNAGSLTLTQTGAGTAAGAVTLYVEYITD